MCFIVVVMVDLFSCSFLLFVCWQEVFTDFCHCRPQNTTHFSRPCEMLTRIEWVSESASEDKTNSGGTPFWPIRLTHSKRKKKENSSSRATCGTMTDDPSDQHTIIYFKTRNSNTNKTPPWYNNNNRIALLFLSLLFPLFGTVGPPATKQGIHCWSVRVVID
jgi:hypothetical protein